MRLQNKYRNDVDVAITDFETGIELMEVSGGHGNVLVVTHDDNEGHVRMALEAGVRGYVLIGCDVATLLASVRTLSSGGTALAPAISSRIADSLSHQPLTPRELTVLRLVCIGLSNKAIASRLCLSCGTIKSHVKSILSKLNANSRTEASSIAQRRAIVSAHSVGELDDLEIVGAEARFIARSFGPDRVRDERNLSVVSRA